MARPSKSTDVLKTEKKSHRTKAELTQRAAAEQAILTGIKMKESQEVREDPIAHKEFARIRKILTTVGKNDALYESVINDYCRYKSDIERYIKMRDDIGNEPDIQPAERVKLVLECDRRIDALRRKRFDIEKENGMTIASSARSIPKTVTKPSNPLLSVLGDE